MDEETANLILQLQLEDLEEIAQENTGEVAEDATLAALLLRQNIAEVKTTLADQRMTTSIAAAVRADATSIAQTVEVRERPLVLVDEATVARLAPLNEIPTFRALSFHQCTACLTQRRSDDGAIVTCGHFYCGECIAELFEASFNDESLFPPSLLPSDD